MEEVNLNEKKEDTEYKPCENLSQFKSKANSTLSRKLESFQDGIIKTFNNLGLKVTFKVGPVSIALEKADKEKSGNKDITKDEIGQGVLSL